jgi:putative transposase
MSKEALMPWDRTCALKERSLFVLEVEKAETGVAELCRQFGISRKTGYKWLDRFEAEGVAGLLDRSHAALNSPHRLSDAVADAVLGVRAAHASWGPKKIRSWLSDRHPDHVWPAQSTIGALLQAKGLTVPRKTRQRVPLSAPLSHCGQPNDVWSVDFKGCFRTGDGRRCDPLTLQDAHSRYLLRCQAVKRPTGACVWPIFDAALREFGVPLRVRSDNGPPFAGLGAGGLSTLAIRLIKAGITPERIAPGKPQQNGRHERMHLTLKNETASPPAQTLRAQQRRFDAFRSLYNDERPHEALSQTPPVRHYAASERRYSGRLREPEYASGIEVRRVRRSGEIRWQSHTLYLSQALSGEPVGAEPIGDGLWLLRYGPVELGIIDHRGKLRIVRHPASHNRPAS